MQRELCRLVSVVVAMLMIGAATARADIDATGTWYVQVLAFGITDTEQWVQTGSTLVINGNAGTINPQTGEFDVLYPPDSFDPCLQPHAGFLSGTVAPDGQTLTGQVGVCGDTPTLCCALGGGISFAVVGSRTPPSVCGDGLIESPETCDDGNTAAGDGCDASCQVESCRVCSGAPSVCTLAPAGSPCDDGNPCTASACDAGGACLVTNPAALDCDDGQPCTIDSCDPQVGCVHAPLVRACRSAESSLIRITTRTEGSKDKLLWKWTRGESTSQSDFGMPTGTTAYTLCLFAGPLNAITGAAEIAPDAHKWIALGSRGFRYSDPSGSANGIRKIVLTGSDTGRAAIILQATGAGLSLGIPPLPIPVTAQLTNSSTNACWSATYAAPGVLKNTPGAFKASIKTP